MHYAVPLRDTNYPNLRGDAAIPMKNHVMMRCCHSFMYIIQLYYIDIELARIFFYVSSTKRYHAYYNKVQK